MHLRTFVWSSKPLESKLCVFLFSKSLHTFVFLNLSISFNIGSWQILFFDFHISSSHFYEWSYLWQPSHRHWTSNFSFILTLLASKECGTNGTSTNLTHKRSSIGGDFNLLRVRTTLWEVAMVVICGEKLVVWKPHEEEVLIEVQ